MPCVWKIFEMIFERLLRIACIYMYTFISACGILNCFQNSLCEARMRQSGVFSLTGFNPLLFFCVLLIVSSRYTDFSLDMSSAFWIPVRCISICDALLVGLLCIHVRALHRVYVGYECIWKSNIYLILSYCFHSKYMKICFDYFIMLYVYFIICFWMINVLIK